MISFGLWRSILIAFVMLVFLLCYAVLKLPISFFFADEMNEMGVTDLDGSSLSGGHLWVSHASLPGLTEVDYAWCPGSGIGSWCLTVESDLVSVEAVVTPRRERLMITDANIHQLSTSVLGVAASLVDGIVEGNIREATLSSYQCPLQHLEQFSAQLKITRLNVMGSSLGEHQIVARNLGQDIEVKIDGESVDGTISLSEGAYKASGELLANAQIEMMARSLMRSLGANRYGWEINGKIPC